MISRRDLLVAVVAAVVTLAASTGLRARAPVMGSNDFRLDHHDR
jgi:hypothetical protein